MESSKFLLLVLVAIQLISIIPKSSSAHFEFLYQVCGDRNYSTPSTYQTNLNTVLKSMSSDNHITYGYYNFTAGHKPNKVEAMALCRSDVSVHNCRSCVRSSAAALPSVCPKATQAFAHSEDCLLYYTDTPAFRVLTDEPFNAIRFDGNLTNARNFNKSLTTLMNTLTDRASLGNSEIKFATGMTKLNSKTSLYGLVQCSPDLSRSKCVECVQYIISSTFSKFFITRTKGSLFMAMGGRVVSPSCNFRYELYPFYKHVTYRPTAPVGKKTA